MTTTQTVDIVWRNQNRLARETIMLTPTRSHGPCPWMGAVLLLTLLFPLDYGSAADLLEKNLDISISRRTKESRLTDIVFEQAKFDPLLSFNGQYNRSVQPLNRPVF